MPGKRNKKENMSKALPLSKLSPLSRGGEYSGFLEKRKS
jgi:hypothetical protein